MYYDNIEKQKKYIKKLYNASIGGAIFFGAFLGLISVLFFVKYDWRAFLLLLIFLIFAIIFIISAIEKHRILRQLSIITTYKTINKTYEVKLYRPKISFMVRGTGYKGRNPAYYGITFFDANKKKYYFFFDSEMINLSKIEIKNIEEKLWRELTVQCYENTSIVKTIENDPYFLRIR